MKKRMVIFILFVGILSVSMFGCANSEDIQPTQSDRGQESTSIHTTIPETAPEEHADSALRYDSRYKAAARAYKKEYEEILLRYRQALSDPTDTEILTEEMEEIFHLYDVHGEEESGMAERLISTVGYNLIDINADNIPELIIGNIKKEQGGYHYGDSISALYTLINGSVEPVFFSTFRDSYFYLGNDKFYNSHLGGDGHSVLTVFDVDARTGVPRSLERYVAEWKDGSAKELRYLFQKSGATDAEISEKEYHASLTDIESQIREVRFLPFSDYAENSVLAFDAVRVNVRYASEEEIKYAYDYDGFRSEDRNAVTVTFTTNHMTKDFRILQLKNVEADEDGNMHCDVETVYHQEVLDPARPFLAGLYFYGSIPNNGISYVNEDGDTIRLYLQISGRDGSLYLQEF